jgi:transposase
MFSRNLGLKVSNNEIKKLKSEDIEDLFGCANLVFMAHNSLAAIKFLKKIILDIEKKIKSQVKLRKEFLMLKTIPGIGNILGLTIMLEVGDIGRFATVGDYSSYCRCVESKRLSDGKKKGENNKKNGYSSYCRCVESKRLSDGKKKGENNKKNGNRYLAWAYVEAANFARRFCVKAQSFYQSKEAKTKPVVAIKALSNKLSRASYYIMRDQVGFDEDKLFG